MSTSISYAGRLGIKLKPLRCPRPLTEDELAKLVELFGKDAVEKAFLLLDHHAIDQEYEHNWLLLVLHLARDHVPGFQFEKPRGRSRWTRDEKILLIARVEDLKRNGHSASNACRILQKRKLYPKQKDLRRQYLQFQGEPWMEELRTLADSKGLSLDDIVLEMCEEKLQE